MLVSPARFQPKWFKKRKNINSNKAKSASFKRPEYTVTLSKIITDHLDNEIGETVKEEWGKPHIHTQESR
jgi:hypothetical protein